MTSLAVQDAPAAAPMRRTYDTLRVALVGCGKMGQQHLRAIHATPHATVVAVADPAASREQLGELLPAEAQLFADPHDMMAAMRPDVVHIVTPPASHASLAAAALRAGSHVYVEKPFTPTSAEAEMLLALANERGLQVCAGHQCLFERANVAAVAALPRIGRVLHIDSFLSFRTVRRTITPIEQAKDILPHAVYPLVEQLRAASGSDDSIEVCAVEAPAEGDLCALLRLGSCSAVLTLTLNGRPVEQYQHIVGTNGSLRADYIIGDVIELVGPGTGLGVLFTPYRRGLQFIGRATKGFAGLIFGKAGSYRGLRAIVGAFYESVRTGGAPAMAPRSILDTVAICERIGHALDEAEHVAEREARLLLTRAEAQLPALHLGRGIALVTGGTGFLGRKVAEELRRAGFGVRVLARRIPRAADRLPGVEYAAADLGRPIDSTLWEHVSFAVHCAAETAGGKDDHERNSIAATRHVLEGAAQAGITAVINVSSLAVLKRSSRPLDERAPLDAENLERGPYVWGKAAAEQVARQRADALGVRLKTIRPGPLVDYSAFNPPGRLGREVGPWYVAIGGKRTPLSVCDVTTAARVIRSYLEDFDAAPDVVNLVEAPAPTRAELAGRLKQERPDLRFLWIPALLVRALSGPAKLLQRVSLGSKKPIDVYAAFASERYNTALAAKVIERASAR